MPAPAHLSRAARRHFFRRAALAPLCMVLVAGLHLVRVWTCRQTPWKGGGFGMFSTVDDESARFLRCYLVTDDGDLPLRVPPAASKAVAELRAAPTQARLDDLARRLAGQAWHWQGERQMREAAAIRERGGVSISAAALHRSPPGASVLGESSTAADRAAGNIEPIPRDEPQANAIPFHSIRIECLRYRYGAADRTLRAVPILHVSAPRAEPAP
jgi:hypothetical protein